MESVGFSFLVFIAVCGICVSLNVDVKNTSGFLNLVSDVDFRFSYLGSGFSSISAPALISNGHEKQKLNRLASSVQSHVRPNYW